MPGPGATDRTKALPDAKKLMAEYKALQAKIAALEAEARGPATVAQGDEEPFVTEAREAAAAKRAGDAYSRQVGEDEAATSLEADTRAIGRGPVAVQRTRDRDSTDYPDDKGFTFGASSPSGDGIVRGGGGAPVYMPGARERAVAGSTRGDSVAIDDPYQPVSGSPSPSTTAPLEQRIATARERLAAMKKPAPRPATAAVGSAAGGKSKR